MPVVRKIGNIYNFDLDRLRQQSFVASHVLMLGSGVPKFWWWLHENEAARATVVFHGRVSRIGAFVGWVLEKSKQHGIEQALGMIRINDLFGLWECWNGNPSCTLSSLSLSASLARGSVALGPTALSIAILRPDRPTHRVGHNSYLHRLWPGVGGWVTFIMQKG